MKLQQKCIVILITVAGVNFLTAQEIQRGLVGAGPDGIFITAGIELLSKNKPVSGKSGYQIERRKKGENQWIEIARISTPGTYTEFLARFAEANNIFPEPVIFSDTLLSKLWLQATTWNRLDSLKFYSGVLPLRIALGVCVYDSTAERSKIYEYRISKIGVDNSLQPVALTQAVQWPGETKFGKIHSFKKEITGKSVEISWGYISGSRPAGLRVFRGDDSKGPFRRIRPSTFIYFQRDTAVLMMRDISVAQKQSYSYYAVPFDPYGNYGKPTDTVSINTPLAKIPSLPGSFSAVGSDSLGGIILRWRTQEPEVLKGIRIFRSGKWGKVGKEITTVSPHDTVYLDQRIAPMKEYFYSLSILLITGEEFGPTPAIIGLFKSSEPPLPPTNLEAQGTKKGVKLTWESSKEDINGYYVYRSLPDRDSLQLISPLLHWKKGDKKLGYTDTSLVLSGKKIYRYAVRASSKSDVLGNYSNIVSVRPAIPTEPLTPTFTSVGYADSTVTLHWEAMNEYDVTIKGYNLYRRIWNEGRSTNWKKLSDTTLPAKKNYWYDVRVEEGKTYEYGVQAVDFFNGVSRISSSKKIMVPIYLPPTPVGLFAEKREKGVFLRWGPIIRSQIEGYKIIRFQPGGKESVAGNVKGEVCEFFDKNVKAGELYFYRIVSVLQNGHESKPSKEISIRP